jgi:ectoine hydroxylase-related dioxygenase (phytanoyl-CoA dioxygenase family)
MREILGGPVARFTDQCVVKCAWIKEEQGGRTFFHQDSYYWLLKPRSGCNVWIPCDPVGKDAIALAVKPGTQRGWALVEHEDYFDDPAYCSARTLVPYKRHRVRPELIDDSDEVLVPMQPGDALFFTNFTWHRSEPNRTGEHLCAYAIAYQLADRDNKFESDPRRVEKA